MCASRRKRLGATRRQRMGDANEDLVDQRRGQQQVTRAVEEEVQKAQEEVRKVEVELRKARRQFDIVDDQIDACVDLDEVKLRDAKCVKLEQVKLRDATTNLIRDWRTDWGSYWGRSIFKKHNKLFRNLFSFERSGTFTEFDWLSQDLPWLRLQRLSNPPSTTQKERMYTHTPVRVEFWDVVKYVENYVSKADKVVKRKHWRIDRRIRTFAQNSPIIATIVVASICKFLGMKQFGSSVEFIMEPHLEVPFEPITEGGNSTNLDGSKNEDRDVRKCLFYANPPHLDLLVQSGGKGVAVFDFKDGDLECLVPIHKLWARCSCRTGMNPNCWCSDGIKKGHAESILNSFLQVYEHLVLAKVGYGVLTDNKHWYLVRRDHDGCFYISKCFNWRDTKPPLLAAIAYLVSSAVDNCNEFDVPPKKGERPWIWGATPYTSSTGGSKVDKHKGSTSKSNEHKNGGSKSHPPRSRRTCSNLREDQLQEIPASDLHLDDRPITTGGGSGYVVGGTLNGRRVAVRFAPRNSERSKALVNGVGAYLKLQEHWGFFVPSLVEYGTTAKGQVVVIATELIDGSPLGPGKAAKEVAIAALEALHAVHASNLLHGDVETRKIMVVQGTQPSVCLIGFGYAQCSSNEIVQKQKEELRNLLNLLQNGS